MHAEAIDTLTRSFARAPMQEALSWHTLWRGMAAAFALLWKEGETQSIQYAPTSAPAVRHASSPMSPNACISLTSDGECPNATYFKREKPGNVPATNGCGPAGGTIKIPQGYGTVDFTASCDQHDICYEDCFTPRETCDDNLGIDIARACATGYPASGVRNQLNRYMCFEHAFAYQAAVAIFGGSAWVAAQIKACECCRTNIWCQCNETCYDELATCQAECRASLGCFTGICEPASVDLCPL
jgi:hypothetical protein